MGNLFDLFIVFIGWALGGFCTGVIGMGAAIIALPICLIQIAPAPAVLCNTLVNFYSAGLLVLSFRQFAEWKEVREIIYGTVPGCLFGAVILKIAPIAFLEVLIGAVLIIFVILQAFQKKSSWLLPDIRAIGFIFGALSGLAGTAVAMGGVPLGIYILLKRWPFLRAKGNLAYIFIFLCSGSLLTQLCAGLYSFDLLPITIAGILGCTIGQVIGVKAGQHINQRMFTLLLMVFLTASAFILFAKALG